ncbi:MAG: glycosyltransferase [Bacteroidia bacterium]|nr:glycosyltransferase [Bacteroidia bacterium]
MKVVILFPNKYPGIGAAAKRVQNYEKGLIQASAEVEVVPIPPPYINPFLQFITPFHVLISLAKKRLSTDILFVYGFGWISKLLISYYTKSKGFQLVFEVNEKPYSIRGSSRKDRIFKYFSPINLFCLTKFVYPRVDGFVVISEKLATFIKKHVSERTPIINIPILVDYNFYNSAKSLKINTIQRPYLIHTATLNDIKDGIIDVFKAFAIVHNRYNIPLHFCLANRVGPKNIISEIDSIISQNNLERYVHFLNTPNDDTLVEYQLNATFTVINKRNTIQNQYNFATKTGEYLASGVPIITSRIGEIVKFLEDELSCLYILTNNAEEIATKMIYILQNEEKASKIALNGKEIAKIYFDFPKQAKRLNTFFNSLVE